MKKISTDITGQIKSTWFLTSRKGLDFDYKIELLGEDLSSCNSRYQTLNDARDYVVDMMGDDEDEIFEIWKVTLDLEQTIMPNKKLSEINDQLAKLTEQRDLLIKEIKKP